MGSHLWFPSPFPGVELYEATKTGVLRFSNLRTSLSAVLFSLVMFAKMGVSVAWLEHFEALEG